MEAPWSSKQAPSSECRHLACRGLLTLRKAGFRVGETADRQKALVTLGIGRFGVIITDLDMPNTDGISLIKNRSNCSIDTP